MIESLKRIKTLTLRNIKEILRDPLSLAFTLALPLVMELLFYYLFHGMTSQFEMKYFAPAIVVFAQAFLTLFTGILISTDRNTAFLTRLFVTKTKPYEFIFSYIFAVLPIATLQSILFFAVGVVVDSTIFSVSIIGCIFISLIPAVFFIVLGILLGSVCSEKSIGGVASIVVMGQSVLSGMWFPTEGLGGAVVKIMRVLPFKNFGQIVQISLVGSVHSFADFTVPLIVSLAYLTLFSIISIWIFAIKMREK